MQGSRHVPAPANTLSLPEGEAAKPGRCGTALRWQRGGRSQTPAHAQACVPNQHGQGGEQSREQCWRSGHHLLQL